MAKVEVGGERTLPTSMSVGVGVGVGIDIVEAGDGAATNASSRYFARGHMVQTGQVDIGEDIYRVVKEKMSAFYQAQHGEFVNPWESPWNNGE